MLHNEIYITNMRKLITGSLMLCSILSLRAQTFVKPAVKVKDTSLL